MSDFIVSQGHTLANPNTLHTVAELRAALVASNTRLLDADMRNHELKLIAHEATRSVALLITARRQYGDTAALLALTKLEESLLTPTQPASPSTH